jgi:pimeloyl-ACP methyl ester carboxylesterase
LIPVERNFVKPRNKTYFLAVATVPALSISPREPLLYLHGGPGIATLSNLTRYLKSRTFSLLRQDHTLIFFDYRGTGFSEPALCKSLGDSLQAISDTIPLKERTTKETSLYSNCKSALLKQDILLSDFSSLQSASDAEMIRKGLGLETVVIYSVSHGTTVALNMMRNFPEHIASVILDSPFPPNAPWLDFIHPFDTCFKVLEQKINENPKYSRLFPSIRDDFITIANRLRKSPIKIPVNKKETVTLYYSFRNYEFAWSVWSAMLNPSYIRLVPLALKEMASGNDSVLIRWAMLFHDPNSFGEYSPAQSKAILGYETKPRFEEETENYLLNEFPDFSHFIAPGLDSTISTVFRPEDPSKEYFDAVRSNIPTLIISGEFDPVCPPLFAGITSKTLPNSTVMIVPSASHAAFFADECTRSVGAMFYLHPENKINLECLVKRKQIEFVTSGILSELD